MPAGWPQSYRCPTARAQASLILSIPNNPLSRQGKSLDYILECVADKIMKKQRKTNRTLLVNFLYCPQCLGPIPPTRSALDRAWYDSKIASFSWAVKCQNSSKSHLFQELKNTLIFRWHYDTILTPQMSILPMSSPNKCGFFGKYKDFLTIFYV